MTELLGTASRENKVSKMAMLFTSHHNMAHKIGVIDTRLVKPSYQESLDKDLKIAFCLRKERQ